MREIYSTEVNSNGSILLKNEQATTKYSIYEVLIVCEVRFLCLSNEERNARDEKERN